MSGRDVDALLGVVDGVGAFVLGTDVLELGLGVGTVRAPDPSVGAGIAGGALDGTLVGAVLDTAGTSTLGAGASFGAVLCTGAATPASGAAGTATGADSAAAPASDGPCAGCLDTTSHIAMGLSTAIAAATGSSHPGSPFRFFGRASASRRAMGAVNAAAGPSALGADALGKADLSMTSAPSLAHGLAAAGCAGSASDAGASAPAVSSPGCFRSASAASSSGLFIASRWSFSEYAGSARLRIV